MHKPDYHHFYFSVFFFLFSGTKVIRVHAVDNDEGLNGQVTYSIVSTHNKFVIDPNNGWLSTNAVSVK